MQQRKYGKPRLVGGPRFDEPIKDILRFR